MLDAQLAIALGADVGVESDHLHPEPSRPLRDQLADPAEAEDARASSRDSSTPENFDRSHLPPVSEAWACGMLRASASSRAIVCSAAVITFDWGALATTMPRLVAAATSTLSTPTPARPTARRRVARGEQVGVELGRRADQDPLVVADPLGQLVAAPVRSRHRPRSARAAARLPTRRSSRRRAPRRHASSLLQDVVDAGGERSHVGGIGGREHRRCAAGCAELAVGLDVDDPVGAQRRGQGGGVDLVVEVDRPDDQRALGRVGDERGRVRVLPRPTRRGGARGRGRARDHRRQVRRRSSIHSSWSASRNSVAIAGVL